MPGASSPLGRADYVLRQRFYTMAGVFSRLTARRPLTLTSPDQPEAASAARRARRPV